MLYVSALTGAALKRLPHTLHPLLQRTQLACAFSDTQEPVTLEFFIPLLYAVLHRWVLSKLGLKTSLHCHDRLFRHTQECSARVAILTQPAPPAATDITKHPRHVQTNLESSSFYRYVACCYPLRHSSVSIFL
jgi:hypothetical protein